MLQWTRTRQETAARPPTRAIFFCPERPRATCQARIKDGPAAPPRAAPAAAKHTGGLERRRHGSRVERASTARPARQCANGRPEATCTHATRGRAGGWAVACGRFALTLRLGLMFYAASRPAREQKGTPPRPPEAPRRATGSPLCARREAKGSGGPWTGVGGGAKKRRDGKIGPG